MNAKHWAIGGLLTASLSPRPTGSAQEKAEGQKITEDENW